MLQWFTGLTITGLVLISCGSNPLDVDVDGVQVELVTHRFDREFFALDFHAPDAGQKLYQQHGQFAEDFAAYLLSYEPPELQDDFARCAAFTTDPYMRQVYDAIQSVHPDAATDAYAASLEDAFRHLKYHFPALEVPEVFFFHSGFYADTYVAPGQIAIGLDYYLGAQHEVVQSLPSEVPVYQREKMRPDYVVTGTLGDYLADQFSAEVPGDKLVDLLIEHGKLMYLMDAALPNTPDSTKIRYTAAEIAWAEENEFRVWQELAKQEVLYNDVGMDNYKWINDGPWTNAGQIPETSPSRLGVWIGWQVVRDFMAEHPELQVVDLLKETNNGYILSAYNPRD